MRAEALDHLFLLGRGDGRGRPPMEGPAGGDDPPAFGMPRSILVLPHHFDRAFPCLDAGIGEKHRVGEGVVNQSSPQTFLTRHSEQIGRMPHLMSLIGQSLDQVRVRMAKGGDGDATGEIQVALAVGVEEIRTFAPFEYDIRTGVDGHDNWDHG